MDLVLHKHKVLSVKKTWAVSHNEKKSADLFWHKLREHLFTDVPAQTLAIIFPWCLLQGPALTHLLEPCHRVCTPQVLGVGVVKGRVNN